MDKKYKPWDIKSIAVADVTITETLKDGGVATGTLLNGGADAFPGTTYLCQVVVDGVAFAGVRLEERDGKWAMIVTKHTDDIEIVIERVVKEEANGG